MAIPHDEYLFKLSVNRVFLNIDSIADNETVQDEARDCVFWGFRRCTRNLEESKESRGLAPHKYPSPQS